MQCPSTSPHQANRSKRRPILKAAYSRLGTKRLLSWQGAALRETFASLGACVAVLSSFFFREPWHFLKQDSLSSSQTWRMLGVVSTYRPSVVVCSLADITQVSWLSWWAQTILSTVAFIILLFSNAVNNRSSRGNIFGNGVALALASLACSAASVCW